MFMPRAMVMSIAVLTTVGNKDPEVSGQVWTAAVRIEAERRL